MIEDEEIKEEITEKVIEETSDDVQTYTPELTTEKEVVDNPKKSAQQIRYEESQNKQKLNFDKNKKERELSQEEFNTNNYEKTKNIAGSKAFREEKEISRKASDIYKNNVTVKNFEIEEFLGGDLSEIIGSDSTNWTYALPQKAGGNAEENVFGGNNYLKLLNSAKDQMFDESNVGELDVRKHEFDEMFLNAVKNRANKQQLETIAKSVALAEEVGVNQVELMDRESIAIYAAQKNMPFNIATETIDLNKKIQKSSVEIKNLQSQNHEEGSDGYQLLTELVKQNKLDIALYQNNLNTYIGDFKTQIGWDSNTVHTVEGQETNVNTVSLEEMDITTIFDLMKELTENGEQRSHGKIMSDNLDLNYRKQIVHNNIGESIVNVTINNEDADAFLKTLKIESTGSNKNGKEYSIPYKVLARYYEELVVSEGDISELDNSLRFRTNFGSSDGYFALTSNANTESFTAIQKFIDDGEFSSKDDPNKSFKRSLKDYSTEHFELIKERTTLIQASKFNIDPSSLSRYDVSLKGVIDFGKNVNTVLDRGAGLDYTKLQTTESSMYKWGSRQVDLQLEQYFSESGIPLSPTLKQNLVTSGLYEFSERFTEFMPVIGKFFLIDGFINKTGLLKGAVSLANRARSFTKNGVLVSNAEVTAAATKMGMSRGGERFMTFMAGKGFKAVPQSAHAVTMEFGARMIIEEAKMFTAFQEHYKLGGGTAFLAMGKMMAKIFPKASTNQMNTFLGVVQSGSAGMISTQMAANLEAFVEDLRGNESFKTHVNEFYGDLSETSRSAILDFAVFSALGLKGVYSIKGAGAFGGFKSNGSLRNLATESKTLAENALKRLEKDPNDVDAKQEFRKYTDIWSQVTARLEMMKPSKEKVKEIAEKTQEVLNNREGKPEGDKIKIKITEQESSYEKSTNTINISGNNPQHLAHEVGHYLGSTSIKNNQKIMFSMFKMLKGDFPGLEKSIKEAYGEPIKDKTGKETGDFMLDRDLTMEEFSMHLVSKLGEVGGYESLVANNVFKRIAESTNNFFIKEYGKEFEVFGKYDLTSKSEVIRFWGNFAKVVGEGKLTEKYLDFFEKTLNDPLYQTHLENTITLDGLGSMFKNKKIVEQSNSKKKFAEDLEVKLKSEMMKLYDKEILPFSTKGSDLYDENIETRKEKELKAVNKFFLEPRMIKGEDGKRVKTPPAIEAVSYWFAGQMKKKYSDMTFEDIEYVANVTMKSQKSWGPRNIIKNYIKYETKDGKEKQDIFTTLSTQLMIKMTDIRKEAFGKDVDQQGFKRELSEVNEADLGTTETKDFDILDRDKIFNTGTVEIAPNLNLDLVKLESDSRKFITNPEISIESLSSANSIAKWFGENTNLEAKLKDNAYVSEKSEIDLRSRVEKEMIEEVKNPESEYYIKNFDLKNTKHTDKLKTHTNKEYKKTLANSRKEFIFTKADLIEMSLPKNVDMTTGESNFVLSTFSDLYTKTNKRFTSADYPGGATRLKKGEGGFEQIKNKYAGPMEVKQAIMDAIFKPSAGGKPLTNAQIKTRIEQAMKYVAYTVANQSARKALNNNDVRSVLEKSNAPLINSLKIQKTYNDVVAKAKKTLGNDKLFAVDLDLKWVEKASRAKNSTDLAKMIYSTTRLVNEFDKNGVDVKILVDNLNKTLFKEKSFSIFDQIIGDKTSEIKLIEGQNFTDGVKKMGFEYDALLITSKFGSSHKAAVYKDKDLQEMVYNGYKDMANGRVVVDKVTGKETVVGGLPVDLVNSALFNKFIGSGTVPWATGVYQAKGVSQSTGKPKWLTFSSDAVKKMIADYKIVGNPNIKLSKKQKQAIKDYKIVDNGEAKRINKEILIEFKKKGADFNDPKVVDKIRQEFNKRTGYTEKVIEANEVVLETLSTSLKKYYDSSPNKVTAMNNLIFTLGTQTSIGGGPIRGLASHRSFSMDLKSLLSGSRSEHGMQAMTFSLNLLNQIKNSKPLLFASNIKEIIKTYKQDIITSKTQKAADYVIDKNGVKRKINTQFPPEILDGGSQVTWLKTVQEAKNQVLMFGDYKTMGDKYTANVVQKLVTDLSTRAGISKQYAKKLDKIDLVETLIKLDKANKSIFKPADKGGTFLDLDDTLVFTNSKIKFTKPNGEKGTLNAEQYAKTYESLTELGYKWDFSEFNEIKEPTIAPLFKKALKLQDKFGPEHMYILTARPPEAAPAIFAYLKSKGLKIPFENITGLGNSTAEAKALWMAEKVGEGYNDLYFADDALQNVQAVKNVLEQFDVKSKVQLARKKYALDLNKKLNLMLQNTKGIKAEAEFSAGRAKIEGKNKKRFSLFMEPSAEDLMGLLYRFAGKGSKGDKDLVFLEEALIRPFLRGTADIDASKQSTTNDYKALKKIYPSVVKMLGKKVPGSVYTHDVAIRVHRWTKAGYEIPDISKGEHKALFEYVANNKEMSQFSEQLGLITKSEKGYMEPQVDWLADTITSDLNSMTTSGNRSSMLFEFVENRKNLFGDWKMKGGKMILGGSTMNKIEAGYGSRFREAMEDIMYRMEYGRKMDGPAGRIASNWDKWVNGSVGSIMFLNSRSATLQMLSTVNYMNWSDNNPLAVGKTLANPKQFFKDLSYIMNSDMLLERRSGLKIDINEAALAAAVDGKSNPVKAAVGYLLKKGFMPTQIADSLAISIGGASFYRNRVNSYKKQGLSVEKAEAKAWVDFTEVTQKTQQSSSPYLISQQQASSLGRTVLSFNNTPMQYNRIMKKAFLDIANKRGDLKTHVSKILYYGAAQNFIFHGLQKALFALTLDDKGALEPGEDEKRILSTLNGMADTILRGTGLTGAVISTTKNVIMEYYKQENKDYNKDHAYTVLQASGLSPSIGSKLGGLYRASKQMDYNKGATEFMSPWAFNNPSLLAKAQVVESATNIPLARTIKKINNVAGALDSNNEDWQRIGMGLGWNKWQLGVQDHEVSSLNEMFKKYKKENRANKKRPL